MVTALVIMVIGNNLARAFGLVGAMSIIRFRAAVKDTRDIAFVFFALAAGMAGGAGNHVIGLVGGLMVILVIIALYLTNFGVITRKELLLKFRLITEEDNQIYISVFDRYLSSFTMLNVRSARLGQQLEFSFRVRFKRNRNFQEFIREMTALEGIDRVNLILGEKSRD